MNHLSGRKAMARKYVTGTITTVVTTSCILRDYDTNRHHRKAQKNATHTRYRISQDETGKREKRDRTWSGGNEVRKMMTHAPTHASTALAPAKNYT